MFISGFQQSKLRLFSELHYCEKENVIKKYFLSISEVFLPLDVFNFL